jgi:hypothetical protein
MRKSSKKCPEYVAPLAKRVKLDKDDDGDPGDDGDDDPDGGGDPDGGPRMDNATTKCKLATVCRSDQLKARIEVASRELTIINYEAGRLANAIALYCCNSGVDIPRMNLTFCRRIFQAVTATQNPTVPRPTDDPLIALVMDTIYSPQRPVQLRFGSGYQLSQIITIAAKKYMTVSMNHIRENFFGRLASWLKLKLEELLMDRYNQPFISSCVGYILANFRKQPDDPAVLRFQLPGNVEPDGRIIFAINDVQRQAAEIIGIWQVGEIGREDWHSFIRPLHIFLIDLKESLEYHNEERQFYGMQGRGVRIYTLLPISSLTRRYVDIDTAALYEITRGIGQPESKETFFANANARWREYFSFDRVTSAGRAFGFRVSTDGCSCSVSIVKEHQEEAGGEDWFGYITENAGQENERKVYQPLLIDEDTLVVGLDPNRSNMFCSVGIRDARETEFKECSKGHWREISGTTYANGKHSRWLARSPNIQQIVRQIPTPCCWDLIEYRDYLSYMLQHRDELLQFYGERRVRNLRFKTYQKKQKAYDEITGHITQNDPDAIVAFGSAQFDHASRGHPALPRKGLFKELRKRLGRRCRYSSERYSSCTCSTCRRPLLDTDFWALKYCQYCRTVWNRDRNACRNIRDIFRHRNAHNGIYPAGFVRRVNANNNQQ